MDIVDLRETRDEGLLEQAYRELYLKCFTDPNEQEDLEQYRQRLFGPQQPIPQPVTHFLVAGAVRTRISNVRKTHAATVSRLPAESEQKHRT